MTQIKIEPITDKVGAKIFVSADDLLNDGVPAQIWDALNKYMVVLFPQIHCSDEQMLELAGELGEKDDVVPDADEGKDGYGGGVYRIANEKKDDETTREFVLGNDYWHLDGTAYEIPNKGTMLKCETPPSKGGDTGFANLYVAYDALSEEKKQQLKDLRVTHCLQAVASKVKPNYTEADIARWNAVFPAVEHPLVWSQSNGKKSLVIGSTAMDIVGMPHEEGSALLQELYDWCTQDQFTYRHQWQKGDMVIFNNPGLLHRSYPYDEASGRVMHRTTLKGTEAFA